MSPTPATPWQTFQVFFRSHLAAGVAPVSLAEISRSALASMLGLTFTAALAAWVWRSGTGPLLVTPIAASSVILFALPHSPLGQPWPFLAGNLLSALIGLAMSTMVPQPLLAGLLAVPLAIWLMGLARCLHPPAGAQALLFAMTGAELWQKGLLPAMAPLTLNLLAMLAAVLVINNLLPGRSYPARGARPATPQVGGNKPSLRRTGLQDEDLQFALKKMDTLLDISEDDLIRLYDLANRNALQRATGLNCGDIMSKEVLALDFATSLDKAWQTLVRHQVKALPVIDRSRRVVGMLTRVDFLRQLEAPTVHDLGSRLKALLLPNPSCHSEKPEVVGQIMASPVFVAEASMPVAQLVEQLTRGGRHHIPVVDERRRLVGMITQSDLLAALYHQMALAQRCPTENADEKKPAEGKP